MDLLKRERERERERKRERERENDTKGIWWVVVVVVVFKTPLKYLSFCPPCFCLVCLQTSWNLIFLLQVFNKTLYSFFSLFSSFFIVLLPDLKLSTILFVIAQFFARLHILSHLVFLLLLLLTLDFFLFFFCLFLACLVELYTINTIFCYVVLYLI